ncbi:hypothetical protein ACTPEF_23415, partial [Clostridioides difficile]
NEAHATDALFEIESEEGWLVKSVYNKFPIIDDMARDVYGVHEGFTFINIVYSCNFVFRI